MSEEIEDIVEGAPEEVPQEETQEALEETQEETPQESEESGESASFKIEIDKSVLLSGGELHAFPNYVVPVTIDTGALSSTNKGNSFDLKGLAYGNLVTYVTISYLESGIFIATICVCKKSICNTCKCKVIHILFCIAFYKLI